MSETLFAQANPTGISGYATTTENGSYGVYFTVSHACTLTAIWFYSPSGATSLPTSTALYSTAAGTSGTLLAQNASPSWSGAAGSGWVRDGSFPATALSTGTTYVGQYYSASFKQGYLYTGSFPGPLFPATSSPSGLAVAATQYFGGDSNAPYLNSANGFPSSTLGAGVNWLCDVEVSLPVTLPTAALPPYQPPAWHPASGPGMPGGEPFAQYPPAPYALLTPPVTPQTGPWRLFPATNGPSTATSNSGDWISGVAFQVTQGGQWLEGYWWWVCASGQSTSPVKCALWNAYQPSSVSGTLISGSVVTSGTLTAGQWNWIPLATPVPLAVATTYIAAIGVNGNYPDTTAQFGSGDPYAAGITDGPLSAFSAQNGSNPDPYSLIGNGIYSTAGTDPSVTIPGTESATYDNLWVDVQVSGLVPAGYAGPFPVWPAKYDADIYTTADSSVSYVVGTEFWLTGPCTVNSVRYFSPAGTAQLATEVTIWNVVTQATVYDNTSPSWSGAAASGWVSCTLTGVTLPPGAYRVTVFNNAGSPDGWSAKRFGYWGGGGLVPGGGPQVTGNGITLGPLYVPSTAQANNCYQYDTSGAGNTPPFSYPDGRQEPGQCVFAESGANTYPSLYVDAAFQNYWIDISVTLTSANVSGLAAQVPVAGGHGTPAGSAGVTGTPAHIAVAGGTGTPSGAGHVTGIAAHVSVAAPGGVLAAAASVTGAAAHVTAAAPAGIPSGSASLTGTAAHVTVSGGHGTPAGGAGVTGVAAHVPVAGAGGTPAGSASVIGTAAHVPVAGRAGAPAASANVAGASAHVPVTGGIGTPHGGTSGGGNVTGTAAHVPVAAGAGATSGSASVAGAAAHVPVSAGTGTPLATAHVTGVTALVVVAGGHGTPSGSAHVTGVAALVAVRAGAGTPAGGGHVAATAARITVTGRPGTLTTSAVIAGKGAKILLAGGIGVPSGTGRNGNVTGTAARVTVRAGTGHPQGYATVLFTVVTARQQWAATAARQKWSVPSARN